MVVCVLLPRFSLATAAGGRETLAAGPAALAPEPGREQLVGEVNAAAEGHGVHSGMRLGEALARCPRLALIPPDPVGVADSWEEIVTRLESVGAQVEAFVPGVACFEADGLRRLHGGSLDGVVAAVRRAIAVPARIGAGPSRFCARTGAARARSRRAEIVRGEEDLRVAPVSMLRAVPETAALVAPLEQLGLGTLGTLARLERAVLADRFGRAGERAWDLARGRDAPLRPRVPGEVLQEELELEESASGEQLGRALELLVDRLVARRERDGRTLRVVVLSTRLVEGGTWRERMVFREPLADAGRMRLVLAQRLAMLPAPAEALRLSVERFGPPHQAGRALFEDSAAERRGRLREAVKQARAAAGPDAALRVLAVDPDSRVPERRAVLTPFE
ncbi:MAG: DNA polymerase-like protein PA0670 [uncultured Solirubrobacteraceae bacterium]|uniref:DNA polymerase-like protein PA0670 n=1 Tax=uncultured Solirubrobacteraceae bacterium TaxID=1162706 RepID=A0A6J4T4E1_9ACTN|nr:MAG: DNA polymerase-like protein PA0670 [uncultured Solirubrobacteraceae bacterium]